MTAYWQVLGIVLIAVIMGAALQKQGKDITLLLGIAACSMVLIVAMQYLSPVIALIQSLQSLCGMDSQILKILLKAVGVGLIAEIACLICNDSGNAAMGKGIQILATAAVLWLSIPLITELMEILQKIMGDL